MTNFWTWHFGHDKWLRFQLPWLIFHNGVAISVSHMVTEISVMVTAFWSWLIFYLNLHNQFLFWSLQIFYHYQFLFGSWLILNIVYITNVGNDQFFSHQFFSHHDWYFSHYEFISVTIKYFQSPWLIFGNDTPVGHSGPTP